MLTGGEEWMDRCDRWTDGTGATDESINRLIDGTDGQMDRHKQVDRWNTWTDVNRWTDGTGG